MQRASFVAELIREDAQRLLQCGERFVSVEDRFGEVEAAGVGELVAAFDGFGVALRERCEIVHELSTRSIGHGRNLLRFRRRPRLESNQ